MAQVPPELKGEFSTYYEAYKSLSVFECLSGNYYQSIERDDVTYIRCVWCNLFSVCMCTIDINVDWFCDYCRKKDAWLQRFSYENGALRPEPNKHYVRS